MDDKDRKIEELEQKLKETKGSLNYWISKSNDNENRIEKLKALLIQMINEL